MKYIKLKAQSVYEGQVNERGEVNFFDLSKNESADLIMDLFGESEESSVEELRQNVKAYKNEYNLTGEAYYKKDKWGERIILPTKYKSSPESHIGEVVDYRINVESYVDSLDLWELV